MRKLKFTEVKWLAADQTAKRSEPRTQVFRHGHEGFFCPRVLGPEPNTAIQKRGHPRPALKEASNPGIWSWKLHLEKNSGGLTSLWLTLRQRFLSWSWMCPTRQWDCAILQPTPTWRSLFVCLFVCKRTAQQSTGQMTFCKLLTDAENKGKAWRRQLSVCYNKKSVNWPHVMCLS